jgi:L-seryl-tRNA(Ser) seleniumtransferase
MAGEAGPATGVVETQATVGGGSLPGESIPSIGLAVDPGQRLGGADGLLAALRTGDPAVIGRIERARVVLDLRTVDPAADVALLAAVRSALAP